MIKESPRRRRAQSTAEYAILIGVIIAVAIAMQTYVKRGMQARVFDASNTFYNNFAKDANFPADTISVCALTAKQYEPTTLSSRSTQTTLNANETLTMQAGGAVKRESTRKTTQATGDYQEQSYP